MHAPTTAPVVQVDLSKAEILRQSDSRQSTDSTTKRISKWIMGSWRRTLTTATVASVGLMLLFGGSIAFNATMVALLITTGLGVLLLHAWDSFPRAYSLFLGGQKRRLLLDAAVFTGGFMLAGTGVTGLMAVAISGLLISTLLAWLPY